MPIHKRPIFTEQYDDISAFSPQPQSIYISGRSVEERSMHLAKWNAEGSQTIFVDILEEKPNSVVFQHSDEDSKEVPLRSTKSLLTYFNQLPGSTFYVDITGLRHHVWAAILKVVLETNRRVIVIYVEPEDYRPSMTPTENEIYDLSDRIEGIRPLPGFARLRDSGDRTCFVPLLGFEGTRVSYLISQLEPPGEKIIPVIGAPGYRPEFPFATYLGNRSPLIQSQGWRKVRFAQANCPFDLFYVLEDIQKNYSEHVLKIAPIGTKPHALGSILYAIANPRYVELVYDHPIRKAERTSGLGRLMAYHVSSLMG
jgi:hypothetical protein